jgi:hypothetical protein
LNKEEAMPDKPTPVNPQDLWQSQPEEEMNVTLATIRSKALKFQTKIRRRNIREYVGLAIGTVLYGAFVWFLPGLLTKVGAVLTLAGMCFSVYRIYRDGSSQEVPVDSSARDCLEFHRRQLVRQRDMLRRVGPRQIGPVMPGFVLFYAGVWDSSVRDTKSAIVMAITGILAASVFGFVYWCNVRAANKMQQELDALGE